MSEKSNFEKLAAIDVSAHIEKKNNLSYLSWAWAVDQLLRADPTANWEFGEPKAFNETVMVYCTVTAFGKPMTMHLPVMDFRNKAISNPDAFAINTAMMRCLVKAIALHGLGLYIYAGEDLPLADEEQKPKPAQSVPKDIWDTMPEAEKRRLQGIADAVRAFIESDNMQDALLILSEVGDADEKTALWSRFDSKERSAIKRASKGEAA